MVNSLAIIIGGFGFINGFCFAFKTINDDPAVELWKGLGVGVAFGCLVGVGAYGVTLILLNMGK